MADCQITCVTKPNRMSIHEHITHLGNPIAGWIWPREKVIQSITEGSNTFYVLDPSGMKRARVGVRTEPNKAPYLQTYSDGYWNNNLLSLNECPLF
jgi:hypothetical protein